MKALFARSCIVSSKGTLVNREDTSYETKMSPFAMLDRAHCLSSSWTHFSDESDRLKTVFSRLKYPKHLVNSTIKSFADSKVCDQQQPLSPSQEKDDTIRVVLPLKYQISADIVRKQLKDLSLKVHTTIQPVFVSRKIEQELNVKETKPPIVNQQCVVYSFQCDLCDAGYVGYTRGHLHNRVKGHKEQSSAICLSEIQQGNGATFKF